MSGAVIAGAGKFANGAMKSMAMANGQQGLDGAAAISGKVFDALLQHMPWAQVTGGAVSMLEGAAVESRKVFAAALVDMREGFWMMLGRQPPQIPAYE